MRKPITFAVFMILAIGLSSFNKTEKEFESGTSSMILGMVLLEDTSSLNMKKVVTDLKKDWNLKVDDQESGDKTSVLVIDGYKIAIGIISAPIPGDEIREVAKYNYLWPKGEREAQKHKGHVILSLMSAGKDPVAENLLFSKVVAAVLRNSESLGVYIGGRTLLLSKDFYLIHTETMSKEDLPLYNWIYFGLRNEQGKQSIYTYGLADFNKKEMEIVNSFRSFNELSQMMFNMAHYVIARNVILKDGETIGISAKQKLKVTESKGKYLEGTTFKIEY